MLARLQHLLRHHQPGEQAGTLWRAWVRRTQRVHQRVIVEPGDTEVRPGEQLQLPVRDVRGAAVLRVPFRRPLVREHEAGLGGEPGQRHVRRHVGRNGQRVDRDLEPAALELPGAREADRPATDDGRLPRGMLRGELRRHQAGAPRQRHARAAVPVVVHEQLVAELLRLQDKASVAMRPQADGRADHAIPRRLDRRESDRRSSCDEGWLGIGAARGDAESDRRHAARREKCASTHATFASFVPSPPRRSRTTSSRPRRSGARS